LPYGMSNRVFSLIASTLGYADRSLDLSLMLLDPKNRSSAAGNDISC